MMHSELVLIIDKEAANKINIIYNHCNFRSADNVLVLLHENITAWI